MSNAQTMATVVLILRVNNVLTSELESPFTTVLCMDCFVCVDLQNNNLNPCVFRGLKATVPQTDDCLFLNNRVP